MHIEEIGEYVQLTKAISKPITTIKNACLSWGEYQTLYQKKTKKNLQFNFSWFYLVDKLDIAEHHVFFCKFEPLVKKIWPPKYGLGRMLILIDFRGSRNMSIGVYILFLN